MTIRSKWGRTSPGRRLYRREVQLLRPPPLICIASAGRKQGGPHPVGEAHLLAPSGARARGLLAIVQAHGGGFADLALGLGRPPAFGCHGEKSTTDVIIVLRKV